MWVNKPKRMGVFPTWAWFSMTERGLLLTFPPRCCNVSVSLWSCVAGLDYWFLLLCRMTVDWHSCSSTCIKHLDWRTLIADWLDGIAEPEEEEQIACIWMANLIKGSECMQILVEEEWMMSCWTTFLSLLKEMKQQSVLKSTMDVFAYFVLCIRVAPGIY